MTLYTFHQGQDPRGVPTLIAHRFSWSAFLLGPLWLVSKSLWLPAFLLALFDTAVLLCWRFALLSATPALLAILVGALVTGLEAAEMRRRRETRLGRVVAGLAHGRDEVEALARLPVAGAQP